jgi:hypothetical protein
MSEVPSLPAPADSHAVGGRLADDSLQALVRQFSQRSTFVRELVQNSIDAGAGRVDLTVVARPDHLEVTVADDGDGMDRETIEERLLVLFSSSKEDDATKIGKFGIGFVSLFAVGPTAVIIDTARHGDHHRLVFDARRRYVLAALDTPFEGTAVKLRIPLRGAAAEQLAHELRRAAHYWCRYARIEIWTEGRGAAWGWPPERVEHPFDVDGPLRVVHDDEHGRAVFGLSPDSEGFVGYYRSGLTLLEAREATIPGVTFRLESSQLEHTIARDNIRRDARFDRLIKRLRKLVAPRLQLALIDALKSSDPAAPAHDALLHAARSPAVSLPDALPCLRTPGRRLVSLGSCGRGLFLRSGRTELLWARAESELTRALERAGYTVLLGPPERHPDVDLAARLLGLRPLEAERAWIVPRPLPGTALVRAAEAAATRERCVLAEFGGCAEAGPGRLGVRIADLEHPLYRIDDVPTPLGVLLINAAHPTAQALERFPPDVAGPLLLYAARRSAGDSMPVDGALVRALLAAEAAT